MNTLRLGLLGIGGYGGQHLNSIATLQAGGWAQLVAVADPFAARHETIVASLRANGTPVLDNAQELIERDDLEAIIIATPIHLHAPQTIAALRTNKYVYLEKPPCATLEEWETMHAARDASGKICAVGFQMQTGPALHFLKRQLIEKTLGELETVWTSVRWKRDDTYYNRSSWAAKWRVEGQPVFDGPATNALAHAVHAALFLAGETENQWAQIERVRGSFKRARPVESYDSVLLEAQTRAKCKVLCAFTHATTENDEVVVSCRCSGGTAHLNWNGTVTLHPHNGQSQKLQFPHSAPVAAHLDFARAISQRQNPATDLDDTLPYLQLVNGALQSSGGAHDFAPKMVARNEERKIYQVQELDEQFADFRLDAARAPKAFEIESAPCIAANDIAPDLPVECG